MIFNAKGEDERKEGARKGKCTHKGSFIVNNLKHCTCGKNRAFLIYIICPNLITHFQCIPNRKLPPKTTKCS